LIELLRIISANIFSDKIIEELLSRPKRLKRSDFFYRTYNADSICVLLCIILPSVFNSFAGCLTGPKRELLLAIDQMNGHACAGFIFS
jgi:hypothetical protein